MPVIKTAAVEEAECDTVTGLKQAVFGHYPSTSMTSIEHFHSKCLREFALRSPVISCSCPWL